MSAFFYHKFIYLLACIDRWKVHNRLVFACTVKTAIAVKCYVFQLAKKALSLGFFVSHFLFLFTSAAINRVNLAFRTTIIEDTHLALAVIPLKVKANNSLIFLPLQTCEKKIAEFPFLLVYNSLI